jgi:hypothetical protein
MYYKGWKSRGFRGYSHYFILFILLMLGNVSTSLTPYLSLTPMDESLLSQHQQSCKVLTIISAETFLNLFCFRSRSLESFRKLFRFWRDSSRSILSNIAGCLRLSAWLSKITWNFMICSASFHCQQMLQQLCYSGRRLMWLRINWLCDHCVIVTPYVHFSSVVHYY